MLTNTYIRSLLKKNNKNSGSGVFNFNLGFYFLLKILFMKLLVILL